MSQRKALNAEELLEKIFHYMNELIDEKEFSTTIQILTDLGRTLVNSDRASFWFWDKRSRQHWTIVALENGKITVPEGTGVVGDSIMKNETIVINNPYEDPRFNQEVDRGTGYVTKSILCIPVTNAKGEVIGAYQAINKLDNEGADGKFSEVDINRLALAAIYCGKTLESYMLYSDALFDSITGLKNKKGFYEYYNKRVLPFLISNQVSVVMGDIDNFKDINATYGRYGGDIALKGVADIIQYSIDIDDEAIRWDEDRFVIILSKKKRDDAREFAERLRSRVEESEIDIRGEKVKLTMTYGVGEFAYENSSDDNIKRASDKLMEAKKLGRNRVL